MDRNSPSRAVAFALALFTLFASRDVAAQTSVTAPSCSRAEVTCVAVSGSVAFGPGATPPPAVDVGISYPFGDGVESLQIRTSGPDYRFVASIPRGANAAFVLRNLPLPWLNDRPVVFDRVPEPQSIVLRPDAGVLVTATFRYPPNTVAPPPFAVTVVRSPGDRWFSPVEVSNGQLVFAVRPGQSYAVEARPAGFGPVFAEFPPQSGPHAVVVNVDRRARPAAQAFTLVEGPGSVPLGRRVLLPIALEEPAPSGGETLPFLLSIVPGTATATDLRACCSPTAGRRQRFALGNLVVSNDQVASPPRTAALRFDPNPFASDRTGAPPIPDIALTLIDDDSPGLLPLLSVAGATPSADAATATVLARPEGGPGEGWTITLELDRPAPAGGAEVTVDTVSAVFVSGNAAIEGVDHRAIVDQRVAFAPGARMATLRIEGIGNDRIEAERRFFLALTRPQGLVPRDPTIELRIVNDDVDGSPAARPDLLPVTPLPRANVLDVLANDVLPAARFPGGRIEITQAPGLGSATVDGRGTATPLDDRIVYTPQANRAGRADRLVYRFCDALGETCVSARVDVPIRPIPAVAPTWTAASESGFRDLVFSGLPALPDARVEVVSRVLDPTEIETRRADPNLRSRFEPSGGAVLDLPPVGGTGPSEVERTVFVHVEGESGSDIDLYVSYDSDGDTFIADEELLCASAGVGPIETCVVRFMQTRTGAGRLNIGVANPGPTPVSYRLIRGGVGGIGALAGVTATAPTRLAEGEAFPVRLSWRNDATSLQDGVVGLLRLRNADGASLGDVPLAVSLPRFASALLPAVVPQPLPLRSGVAAMLRPASGTALDRVFIDVPPGTAQLSVSASGGSAAVPVTVSLRRAALPSEGASAVIAAAPAEDAGSIVRTSTGGTLDIVVANPPAGRWFVVVSAASTAFPFAAVVTLTPTLTTATPAPVVRPGGYFNPSRSGHGLFLYPTGRDWAGIWYAYSQDGAPVWYYLQAPAPGTNGIWSAPVFRSGWNGSRNHLTEVGRATITPTANDAFQFTYVLDGETGSEPFTSFGRGCPSIAGRVVDASGHWFDPARAGAGYSVQLFPNSEFYAVFAYSARGVPRFLVAERNGVGAANDTLVLQQLRGFCPLCVRPGNPERSDVGVLRREFVDGRLSRIAVEAAFTNGTPGTWVANDAVVPLGGLQGCAVN